MTCHCRAEPRKDDDVIMCSCSTASDPNTGGGNEAKATIDVCYIYC